MTIEDELSELREHVRELQGLVVSIIPDDRVARLDELNLVRMTIAERAGTHSFELVRRYIDGGRYGFVVKPAMPVWARGSSVVPALDPAIAAYVDRLRRLGMEIVVEDETP